MEVLPSDIVAIDTVYASIQNLEFNRWEGKDILELSTALGRLLQLKKRLQQELEPKPKSFAGAVITPNDEAPEPAIETKPEPEKPAAKKPAARKTKAK